MLFRSNGLYLPELAGSDVSRYEYSRKKGQWIKYGPWLHDSRPMDWLTGPRILIREISSKGAHKIHACYIEDLYCNYKTILNVNPTDEKHSMEYLLGVINSKLISFIYPLVSNKMLATSFPRLSVGDVKQLPIRVIDFENPADVARHDTMVSYVQTMLELHKDHAVAGDAHEKVVLRRQIDGLDREIDRLVYDLYDLTEKEIAIVESGTQ